MLPAPELIGTHRWNYFGERQRTIEHQDAKKLAARKADKGETSVNRKDGEIIEFRYTVKKWRTEECAVISISATSRNKKGGGKTETKSEELIR